MLNFVTGRLHSSVSFLILTLPQVIFEKFVHLNIQKKNKTITKLTIFIVALLKYYYYYYYYYFVVVVVFVFQFVLFWVDLFCRNAKQIVLQLQLLRRPRSHREEQTRRAVEKAERELETEIEITLRQRHSQRSQRRCRRL